MTTEHLDIPRGGIDILLAMQLLDERCSAYTALIEHRVDGRLEPIRVDIDRVTWEVICTGDWKPVIVRSIIVGLERIIPEDLVPARPRNHLTDEDE